MKLGDLVKKLLSPFVKGTSLEHCSTCEKRRVWLNGIGGSIANFFAKITCPCFWKGLIR